MNRFESPHLGEERLLGYLDGELPAREAAQVREHLEACWQCRTELDELQKTVGECMRFRKAALGCYLPTPPAPWRDIRRQFADVDSASRNRPYWAGIGEVLLAPVRRPARWAPAAIALLAIVGIVYQLWETPRVEAAQLLRKAVAAGESRRAAPRRIRIRAGGRQITRLVQASRPATRMPDVEPVEASIQAMFVAARYDWNDPLSPGAYLAWHQQLPDKRDEVANTDSSYVIRTTTGSSELVEATLTLRQRDLRAVEGTFLFRNHERVEMSELPDKPVGSAIAGANPLPPPVAAVAPPPPASAPPAATPGDELRVFAALHQIGADLGDPLEVIRSGPHVVVTGVGIEPTRQQQIARRLESLPRVATQFDQPVPGGFPTVAQNTQRSPAREEVTRLQAQLEMHVGGRASFERFADQLLQAGDRMMAHAHAYRRLAERFPPHLEATLEPAERPLLEKLRHDHAAAIRQALAGIEVQLVPALRAAGAVSQPAATATAAGTWQDHAAHLFQSALELERLLAAAVGGATPPDLELGENDKGFASHLMTSLDRMRAIGGAAQSDVP